MPAISHTGNLINGQWHAPDAGRTLTVTNPATDETLAHVPDHGAEAATAAIAAADAAFPAWSHTPAPRRAAIVRRIADLMRRDADTLAALMTAEQGKPLAESRSETHYAASFFENAADLGPAITGDVVPGSRPDQRILALRQPVGVCAIITPWNFPAAMITRKLGPALAAGCTAVIKPAELTPLTALAIAGLCVEAGVPAGVVNVVTGQPQPIGETFLRDPRVRKLSFTGSTKVGKQLMAGAAHHVLRLSLELGGHAPFIVFDDADLDAAVDAAVANKFRNAGQTCICANRFYVHDAVFNTFAGKLRDAVSKLRVGVGTDERVHLGPLINDAAIEKVERHVADARDRGATVTVGGHRVRVANAANRFFAPTVIEHFTDDMLLNREETFGPVAPLRRFHTDDEAVTLANDSPYGLAAYFFTRNASRLMRIAEQLDYGMVGANDAAISTAQAPFGGVKQSGLGREGGRYAFDEYTRWKYVSWAV